MPMKKKLVFIRFSLERTRFLLDLTRSQLASVAFTGFYRVLPSFTGFYWVLLGFVEFYGVLLSFT